MLALVEAIERSNDRLEHGTLGSPHLGNAQLFMLGVLAHVRPAAALRLQPAIQLLDAGKAQPWLKEPPTSRLHLVFDLTLFPPGRRSLGRARVGKECGSTFS